ncbi:MAG: peptidoglycan bridge formation glycyltransferase FemA/FemB family protein [Anaerolineaceae bacterium]
MPIVNPTEWSEFFSSHPEAHILQGPKWGELKAQFGWKPIQFIDGFNGAQVLIRQLPFGQKMAYIPKGPIGQEWSPLINDIDNYCIQNRIIFLKTEPDDGITGKEVARRLSHAIPSPQTIQPSRSIVIDLKDNPDTLLARMKQKTRYNIGLAKKKGVTIRPWDDLKGFHRMMQITGERDTFGVHSVEYYQKAYDLFHPTGACELLAAEYEGEILAALMAFSAGTRAWYFYGASSDTKRNLMPTYLLQWEAMLWAKNNGCNQYDLWGVPDFDEEFLEGHFNERRDGLWGVYRFKRGFGGSLIRSAGTFDHVYQRPLYDIYRLYIMLFKRTD